MPVDAATTRRIAHLARIAVKDEEVAHLQGEINAVLADPKLLKIVLLNPSARFLCCA